jgi:hypothetical protein
MFAKRAACVSGLLFLATCATPTDETMSAISGADTPTRPKLTATSPLPSTSTPVPTPGPADDSDGWDYETWLASRPRKMEAYGLEHLPDALPSLPPGSSVDMPIWGSALPRTTIEGEPEFIDRAPPEPAFSAEDNLMLVGCVEGDWGELYCQADSRLLAFGCESLYLPSGVYADTGLIQSVIARCIYEGSGWDEPRENYLFRTGCAFRKNNAYILLLDHELQLVKTPAELQALSVPIRSTDQALNYAQLMTGLVAAYQLEPEREYLYFYDPVEATTVIETADGYQLTLFHYQTCLCEPWINSEVELLVSREGEITWFGARPWSMTIGFSCAD